MNEENVVMRAMPRYQCHKKVWALKIKAIDLFSDGSGSVLITPEEPGYAPFIVDWDYYAKHKPQVGGYYVQYEGGYKSFSPAEAFEEGYALI